ncbi:MAG: fumarylacetoacetate hydrolase [candidate division Zixibacteria bacterium CG_4_9_14_3_um_filter_46_8]|nr:MAG: fumarylacetoacetate hydrolase [candidate division Zixibacteria bacterium CG_4_9_14_3_um_filter_46_8]
MKLTLNKKSFTPQRIFCIGQNYAEHIKEMKSDIPKTPTIFMKPVSSLVSPGEEIRFPKHGQVFHHEVEIVVLIGKDGRAKTAEDAKSFIAGITIGLDLTLRDLQKNLKDKGLPWEISKSFDQSAPIGKFVSYLPLFPFDDIQFTCMVNGQVHQRGNTKDMVFPIERLIIEISRIWKLLPGDLIFTGTPSGVGPLQVGESVKIASPQIGTFEWQIVKP